MTKQPVALIPAYKPEFAIVNIARELLSSGVFGSVVCVNDGSGSNYDELFCTLEKMGITVLKHACNLGKGAALKTGINHAAVYFPESVGVVTLDADGQHLAEDCVTVARALLTNPDSLVMGCRTFDDSTIPLRSRIGNNLTKYVTRFFSGISLSDTQTGLRGIPAKLFSTLLRLKTSGYDFELDMLMCTKVTNTAIVQVPITTMYINENASSHFNPFWDSLKIYMVFLRFNISSILTLLIDYILFFMIFTFSSSIGISILAARFFAGTFNYIVNRKLVFKSDRDHLTSIIFYIITVILFGVLAYTFINLMTSYFNMNVLFSKAIIESLLYIFSFIIQREFIFTNSTESCFLGKTDWAKYYTKRSFFSNITSYFAFQRFINDISPFLTQVDTLVELGGANSIFYDRLVHQFPKAKLFLIDQCSPTPKFIEKTSKNKNLYCIEYDLLSNDSCMIGNANDCVFSFGLIEHFDTENTAKIIEKHFYFAKDNSIVYISFPTPTIYYKITRKILESLGKWPFHDERPLEFDEVINTVNRHGLVLKKGISYRLGLTQGIIVARKKSLEV